MGARLSVGSFERSDSLKSAFAEAIRCLAVIGACGVSPSGPPVLKLEHFSFLARVVVLVLVKKELFELPFLDLAFGGDAYWSEVRLREGRWGIGLTFLLGKIVGFLEEHFVIVVFWRGSATSSTTLLKVLVWALTPIRLVWVVPPILFFLVDVVYPPTRDILCKTV